MNKTYKIIIDICADRIKVLDGIVSGENAIIDITVTSEGKSVAMTGVNIIELQCRYPDYENCESVLLTTELQRFEPEKGRISFTLPNSMVTSAGLHQMQLVIYHGGGHTVTARFNYYVTASVVQDEPGDDDRTTYREMMEHANSVIEAAGKVDDAEAQREADEEARVSAEAQRRKNETERKAAEEARVSAEEERASAESAREEIEAKHREREFSRMAAENAREAAEEARVSAESGRVSAEEARATAEESRVNAEEGRVSAEETREEHEIERNMAEFSRASYENLRQSAEEARVLAEESRVSAEETRATAEEARENAEEERATLFEDYSRWTEFDENDIYRPGNKVSYNGSSYICTQICTGDMIPGIDTDYWRLVCAKGEAFTYENLTEAQKLDISKSNIIENSSENPVITLNHNDEVRCPVINSLSVSIAEDAGDDYNSMLIFTAPDTITENILNFPDNVYFKGDDCYEGKIIPVASTRYNIFFYYEGTLFIGVVVGIRSGE